MALADSKNKVGLVIGSGGAKALGIGVLFELLEENNIKPDLVVGCSGGSILSTDWASGTSIHDLNYFVSEYVALIKRESVIKKLNYRTLLSLANYPGGRFSQDSGIMENEWLLKFFNERFGQKRLEDSPIETVVIATDLNTGEVVPLQHGLISESVYASCALYPILPPIHINNKWLVDGAYYSAMPIFEATKRSCDKIIAVSFEEKKANNYNSFFEFYMEFTSQLLNKNARKQNAFVVNFHHDEILFINCYFEKTINFWDVDYVPYIYDVTSKTIEKNKDAILTFLKS